MMDKENNHQLELFSKTGADANAKAHKDRGNPLFEYLWNREKTILMIIGFIVTGIVSFSLGVEKGKRLGALNSGSRFDLALKIQPSAAEPVQAKEQEYKTRALNEGDADKKESPIQSLKQPGPNEPTQSYTIQVASFQTKTLAKKEAEILKKNGFLPLILYKGKYTVLCIGNFNDKENAKSSLSKLKKRYQDCFIRRL